MRKIIILIIMVLMSTFIIGAITYGTYFTKNQILNTDFNTINIPLTHCGINKTSNSINVCTLRPTLIYNITTTKTLYTNITEEYEITIDWLRECKKSPTYTELCNLEESYVIATTGRNMTSQQYNICKINLCIDLAKENYRLKKLEYEQQSRDEGLKLQQQLQDDWIIFSNITFE